MLLQDIREELIYYGKKAVQNGLTKGTGGNLSVCDRESSIMAITPSGIDYFEIKPEQIVLIDVQTGKIVDGDALPSSERDMHRIFYKYRTDLDAIIHTHSIFAATLSCLRQPLPAVHYMSALAGGDVRCAEYATYGTVALAKNAFFNVIEEIEFCCEIYYRTKSIGDPVILPEDEMARMVERFKAYGKKPEEHEEI